ncbi:MAG: glycoside hydrolase family 9 protein, partial [Oscillospiraceae bacterium]|nr:glycoside hydrolase family 9 protein [Oscillospiraceae bacterium]
PSGYVTEGTNPNNNRQLSKYDGKCYMDSDAEWTTNENTIYGNAAMIFLTATIMSRIQSEQLRGDVSGDGIINAVDLTLAKRGILNGFADRAAEKAADVDQNGSVDAQDIAWFRQYLLIETAQYPDAGDDKTAS